MTPREQFFEALSGLERPRVIEIGTCGWEGRPPVHHKADTLAANGQATWLGVDILPGEGVDLVADAHELGTHFSSGHFDAFVAEATFEHFRRPWVVVAELAKVVRPGGFGWLETHQSFPLHGFPSDYFRFSAEALGELFAPDAGWEMVAVEYKSPARIVPIHNAVQASGWNFEAPAWLNVEAFVRRLKPKKPAIPAGPLRLDLGGGRNPKAGFFNVDQLPTADVVCDFEAGQLPFENDSVEEVYSSHTLEHVREYKPLLREIARVCKVGARVEVRVPHWLHPMALCTGHVHTITPVQVRHWCQDFIQDWWGNGAKRFKHISTEARRDGTFEEAQRLFAWLTPEQVMQYVPGAAHEIVYIFEVIPNEFAA